MPGTTPILHLPYPLASEPPDGPAQIKALADALDGQTGGAQGLFIVGEVRFVAVSAAPAGWLLADGSPVSRATYAKLFAAIASAFGNGDGTSTFNLPDVRGRALVGAGTGPGLTARAVGTKWGVEAVVLSAAQSGVNGNGVTGGMNRNDPHTHYIPGYPDASGGILAVTNLANASSPTAAGTMPTSVAHEHALGARNADASHENAPPSIAVPAYIYAGA